MQMILTSCCLCVTKLCQQKLTPGNLFHNKLKTGISEELKGAGFHTVACNIRNVFSENDASDNVLNHGPKRGTSSTGRIDSGAVSAQWRRDTAFGSHYYANKSE